MSLSSPRVTQREQGRRCHKKHAGAQTSDGSEDEEKKMEQLRFEEKKMRDVKVEEGKVKDDVGSEPTPASAQRQKNLQRRHIPSSYRPQI
ncbi:hypothetical protein Q5P01_025223 [Channa striata]|uniref:Uncharacterized protein n=1 Tax=Channa striata TaxID=64152 RepID=A0AA88II87_CHASR|nr:hypothetical protein Q5P01_025223 [Channa striata]